MANFKETLKDAVRQMSFRTSLDSLKKKGVQQVSVLGIDRIIALVEAAVHRSLRSHLVGIEREAVADATKAEFVRLLRSNEDLQRQKSEVEQQKERAEEEIDVLRRDLASQQQALQIKLEQGALSVANRYEGENAAIAKKVSDVLQALAGNQGLSVTAAEEKVMELVMDVVSGERKAAETARAALRDREVDTLQRRITKLNESLGLTERRLLEVAAMKNIDNGISSVYREVQGLSDADAQQGKKKELMADIFKANLKLQKKA
jgi:Skp family chaperone for outer membrane proteins